jgi:prolyl 4-hydroxylase
MLSFFHEKISTIRQARLKCRYINYDPTLLIAPVKEEDIFDDPKIVFYHDIISDKYIDLMKRSAISKVLISDEDYFIINFYLIGEKNKKA